MRLVISPVEAGSAQDLPSLYRWLLRDTAVASYGQLTVQAVDQQPCDMGGAFDVINAALADGSAMAGIGSLVVAYRAWRETRPHAPAFTIEKDGVTVVLDRGSEQELRQILSAMLPDTGTAGDAKVSEEIRENTSGDIPAGSAELPSSPHRST